MIKLAILDTSAVGEDVDYSVFEKFGDLKIYSNTSPEQLEERISDRDIVITSKVLLKDGLSYGKNLKLICVAATGTNNIDLAKANEMGIAVVNVAGYSTQSVAQHTFAMLFYLYEKLRYFDDYVRSGEYARSRSFTNFGRVFNEIEGKTWGIIGLGTIGSKVASIASAFGCNVIYYSTSGKNYKADYKRVEKEELFRQADIISIHAPLNGATQNLITFNEMSLMKKDAVLINVGRGSIVNEKDLTRALNENIIAAAALDVLEFEPMSQDSPLNDVNDREKLLVTPHIAWASIEARGRLINEIVLNIEAFLEGKSRNRVC